MVYFEIINNELRIEKKLTNLDLFVINTTNILSRYTKYVIISGYVSIFFGRARGTEDVDLFIEDISEEKFIDLYNEFVVNGYEFNIANGEELYKEYLKDNLSVNVWNKDLPLIRQEIKIATKSSQKLTLSNRIKVFYNHNCLYFSPIEYQIAYKRIILKGDKDFEDARHLEIVFKNLNKEKIENYSKLVMKEFKDE